MYNVHMIKSYKSQTREASKVSVVQPSISLHGQLELAITFYILFLSLVASSPSPSSPHPPPPATATKNRYRSVISHSKLMDLSRSLNFHISNLNRIRRFLDFDACHSAVRALILSKLDYFSRLLNGLTQKNITRLQRIQNRCAKLIFKRTKLLAMLLLCHVCSTTFMDFLFLNASNSAPLLMS